MIDPKDNNQEDIQNETVEDLKKDRTLYEYIELPDGTEKAFPVLGGYFDDGYDRTLNILISSDDLLGFVKAYRSEFHDLTEYKDPCDGEIGYQVCIDLTDHPISCYMRSGPGGVSLMSFFRFSGFKVRHLIEKLCGTACIDSEGVVPDCDKSFEGSDTHRIACGILGLRQYLITKGIVQRLYEKFDESQYAQVSVSKTGNVTAKIVGGPQRPDIPSLGLDGVQCTGRPYYDEIYESYDTRAYVRDMKDYNLKDT
jgi:hypothetical protein